MSLVSVLIPVTLVLVGFGVWAFFWAVRSGQFDDLDVPAWEVLLEERSPPEAGPSAPQAASGPAAPYRAPAEPQAPAEPRP
jgi:cbb3-type cytochrome oxidase maturation protein